MTEQFPASNEQRLAEARLRAEEMITTGKEAVDIAETIVGVPLIAPTEKRDETPLPEGAVISRIKEKTVRAALAEVGIGMIEDKGLEEAGLSDNALVLLEPGQLHKILAEARLVGTGPVVLPGSKYRQIVGKEREVAAFVSGRPIEEIGETEYDLGCQAAEQMEGFEALEIPEVIGKVTFDGQIAGGEVSEDEICGTLQRIGTRNGSQPLYVLDVPRKYLFDETGEPILDDKGKQKYDQPNAAQQLLACAELLGAQEAAVATSSTYFPSRLSWLVQSVFSALKNGRSVPKMEVVAYCPATLAAVKKEPKPSIPSVAHILGEAYATRISLNKLEAEILGT